MNELESRTRMETLDELFRKQEMDILFLQEVTHYNFDTLRRYTAYTNVGTSIRGTAMITKEELAIKNFTGLPSGLGIAADFQGYWLINNYAPSRTARGQEREFLQQRTHIPAAVRSVQHDLKGNFTCVLDKANCTGQFNYTRAFGCIFRGFDLNVMWETDHSRSIFTHYTPMGASRLDRIYTTRILSVRKTGVETVAAAFTSHLTVILHLSLDTPIERRGRGFWKMNITLLNDTVLIDTLGQQWAQWLNQRNHYPDRTTWWELNQKKFHFYIGRGRAPSGPKEYGKPLLCVQI
jgi:hypothetical protein